MKHLSIALTVALSVLLSASPSLGGQRVLQNETLDSGAEGTIQLGFIAGDIGAAVLEANANEYPITLQTIQVLIADETGIPGAFRDYTLTVYTNGNVNPGAPVHTVGPLPLAANAITEIDISAQNIVINSGKFTIGASPSSGPSPASPNLITSTGGCVSGLNRIRDVNSGLWFDGCILGISGQLAIRCVVDTNGGGGGPAPQVLVVVPAMGPASGGSSVEIFGNNFVDGATVSFDGNPATGVVFVSANKIDCVSPPGAGGGMVDVQVCNPDLQCGTLTDGFEYEATSLINHTGSTGLGDQVPLTLASASQPNKRYLVLASRSIAPPGIPLSDPGDSRTFPLNFDFQMFQAIADGGAIFQDFTGRLDGSGNANAMFRIPNMNGLIGIDLHFAYAVINSGSPSGVADISNVTSFTVDP